MAEKKQGSRKAPRTHNPEWKDSTRTERSNKRKAELQAAAERDGFATWSEAITAWKNGTAVLVRSNMYTYKFSAEDRLWLMYYPDGSYYGEYETEEEAKAECDKMNGK